MHTVYMNEDFTDPMDGKRYLKGHIHKTSDHGFAARSNGDRVVTIDGMFWRIVSDLGSGPEGKCEIEQVDTGERMMANTLSMLRMLQEEEES